MRKGNEQFLPEPEELPEGTLVSVVDGPYKGKVGTFVKVCLDGMSLVDIPGYKMAMGKLEPFTSAVKVRKVNPNPIIIVDENGVIQ